MANVRTHGLGGALIREFNVAAAVDSELVAAPAAGKQLHLVELMFQNQAAVDATVTIKDGATAIIGPFVVVVNGTLSFARDLATARALTAASALNLDLLAGGAFTCFGYCVEDAA